MEHAEYIVLNHYSDEKAHVYHNYSEAWAKKCVDNEYLTDKVFEQFEKEILAKKKDKGYRSGFLCIHQKKFFIRPICCIA